MEWEMNFNLQVKDIIKETFLLTGKIDDKETINNLKDFVRNNKDENLSYKTNVKGHFTGFQSLINNSYFINFLKIIQPQISIIFSKNFMIKEAWGNILKKGEEVLEHLHDNTAFCGLLYLSDTGPGTYFKEYNLTVSEEIGKYVLFSPLLLHSVKKIETDIERITIAFNMGNIKDWDNLSNIEFINKP